MEYVVRFSRTANSTGPDAVLIRAERYSESYHEGRLASYRFFDAEDVEVALVRAEDVTYIACAGRAVEPDAPERALDDRSPITAPDARQPLEE